MSIEVIKAFRQKPIVIYPVYLDITGDYATAAALAQVLYWHEVMHGKFYKIDVDFEKELHLTPKQFKRVKTALKALSFLTITVEQVPAKTFYDVDYKALTKLIESIIGRNEPPSGQSAPPQKVQTKPSQKEQTRPSQKGQTGQSQKGQTITENTTEIKTEITNNNALDEKTITPIKSVNEILLLSLVGLNDKQKAEAATKLAQLLPDQRNIAIQVFNKTVSLGGVKSSPMALLNKLVNLGLKNELEPIGKVEPIQITPPAPQKPAISDKEYRSARIEVIKTLISDPKRKERFLIEFEEKGAVYHNAAGGAIMKPDLEAAGLFN